MGSVGSSQTRDKGVSYVFIIVVKPSFKLTVTRVWSCPGSSYETPNVAKKPWPREPASKGHDLLSSRDPGLDPYPRSPRIRMMAEPVAGVRLCSHRPACGTPARVSRVLY